MRNWGCVTCSITAMKNRKVKMALGTIGLVGAGVAIPAWAVCSSSPLQPCPYTSLPMRIPRAVHIDPLEGNVLRL
jgi:hypothetical protein